MCIRDRKVNTRASACSSSTSPWVSMRGYMAQRISSCGRSDCASSLEVSARHLRIFFDEFGVQFFDDEHSCDKTRFLMLGMSSGASLLIVCHCERDHGATIRIISARKASPRRVHEPLMSNVGPKESVGIQKKVLMNIPFSGGCACCAIRYECFSEPLAMLNCHGLDCQKSSGAPFAAGAVVATKSVKLSLIHI